MGRVIQGFRLTQGVMTPWVRHPRFSTSPRASYPLLPLTQNVPRRQFLLFRKSIVRVLTFLIILIETVLMKNLLLLIFLFVQTMSICQQQEISLEMNGYENLPSKITTAVEIVDLSHSEPTLKHLDDVPVAAKANKVTGQVLCHESKDIILFATVILWQNGKLLQGTETDFYGQYSFSHVLEGEYEIEITYLGYESFKEKILVKNALDSSNNFTHELQEGIMFCSGIVICERLNIFPDIDQKQSDKVLRGFVQDSESQEPLMFANIALYKDDVLFKGTMADVDGYYRFDDLEAIDYEIEISYVGYSTLRKPISVLENEAQVIFHELTAAAICPTVTIVASKVPHIISCCHTTGTVTRIDCFGSDSDSVGVWRTKKTKHAQEGNILNIYPNPTTDYIHLQVDENVKWISISNTLGQLIASVRNTSLERITLPVSHFISGTYYLTVSYQDGSMQTEQFVKVE